MKSFALAFAAASLALGGTAFAQSQTTQSPSALVPMTRPAVSIPSDHVARRMTDALNLLEAKGYGAFSDFRPDGKDYTASVSQDGRRFTVLVDPDSGQVTRQG